jgi:hypothetical protein
MKEPWIHNIRIKDRMNKLINQYLEEINKPKIQNKKRKMKYKN